MQDREILLDIFKNKATLIIHEARPGRQYVHLTMDKDFSDAISKLKENKWTEGVNADFRIGSLPNQLEVMGDLKITIQSLGLPEKTLYLDSNGVTKTRPVGTRSILGFLAPLKPIVADIPQVSKVLPETTHQQQIVDKELKYNKKDPPKYMEWGIPVLPMTEQDKNFLDLPVLELLNKATFEADPKYPDEQSLDFSFFSNRKCIDALVNKLYMDEGLTEYEDFHRPVGGNPYKLRIMNRIKKTEDGIEIEPPKARYSLTH